MEPIAICCPNCGAGLGPPQDGQYLCAYCGHRSAPPAPPLDQARQDELVARAIARNEAARFARERSAAEEIAARGRAAGEAGMRAGAQAIVGVLVMFILFASVSLGTAIYYAAGGGNPRERSQVIVFCVLIAAAFLGAGAKIFADTRRSFGPRLLGTRSDRRLLAEGLQGRAIVTSYLQKDLLESQPRFDMVLRIELPGRPSYVLKRSERVPCPETVTTGAELPVFVDPKRSDRALIDWETARRLKS